MKDSQGKLAPRDGNTNWDAPRASVVGWEGLLEFESTGGAATFPRAGVTRCGVRGRSDSSVAILSFDRAVANWCRRSRFVVALELRGKKTNLQLRSSDRQCCGVLGRLVQKNLVLADDRAHEIAERSPKRAMRFAPGQASDEFLSRRKGTFGMRTTLRGPLVPDGARFPHRRLITRTRSFPASSLSILGHL